MQSSNIILHSTDGITKKYCTLTEDKYPIPSVRVQLPEKTIYCLSSQLGCGGVCVMCKNSNTPFLRNVTIEEYFKQINLMMNDDHVSPKKRLISFMGQGEPLDNAAYMLGFIRKYMDDTQHVTTFAMATIANNLGNLLSVLKSNAINMKTTISLHASTDNTRRLIIPTATSKIRDIIELTSGYNVEYNYVLIKGINDSQEELSNLVSILPRNAVVKLNKFNHWDGCGVQSVSDERRLEIYEWMLKHGISAEIYNTDGSDINAACGQM